MIMDCWICSTVSRGFHITWMFTLGSSLPDSSSLSRTFCLIVLVIKRRSIARLLVNEQSFWAEAYLCCFCKKNNINIKWLNQSITKKMVQCRRTSESHRIFRPGTLIVMLCNFVVSWDASSCIICKSKGMTNSVKMELKMYYETRAVAFSESALHVWFMYGVARVEVFWNTCSLGYQIQISQSIYSEFLLLLKTTALSFFSQMLSLY